MWRWLTGGRPMTRGEFRFVDIVSGRPIYYFHDLYGRLWLAERPWSRFRVNPST